METTLHNRGTVLTILYGGGIMSLGLYFNLTVIGEVGLLLSTTISGGVGISSWGSLPPSEKRAFRINGLRFRFIIITALVLLAAGFFCNKAAEMRDKELSCSEKKKGVVTGKVIFSDAADRGAYKRLVRGNSSRNSQRVCPGPDLRLYGQRFLLKRRNPF